VLLEQPKVKLTGNGSSGIRDKTTGEHVPGFWDDKNDPYAEMLRKYAERTRRYGIRR